jgi:hypothetical protein
MESYQQRSFDDHFFLQNSAFHLKTLAYNVSGDGDFYYPGSSYTCLIWVHYCSHRTSVQCTTKCVECETYSKIHPLLYIPDVRLHDYTLSLGAIFKMMKKYVHGTWWLYLDFFPIPNELKKKIYYILAYLMFFHPTYKFKFSQPLEGLRKRLSPLYQLTQGFQEEKK